MLSGNVDRLLALGIILTLVCTGVSAQQKVYKWVDKDGVTHFSDAPPDESERVEAETLTTKPAPTLAPATPPAVEAPSASLPATGDPAASPAVAAPPVKAVDISKMSLAELDQRCDDARERKIAPLREAEIEKCKQNRRNDPAWCERFNADFGEGGRTESGGVRPRMFNDLPECVDAQRERNQRGR